MTSWMRNVISRLYDMVLVPIAATCDALKEKLDSVRGTVTLLYNRFKDKLGYGQTLKSMIEEQAMQDYIGIEDIKHLYPKSKKTEMTEEATGDGTVSF